MKVASLGERLVRVTLAGRLDTLGVDRVETRFVAHLVPGGNNAIIDLSEVDFVASMGIRMLVSAARSLRTRHAKLALYGAQSPVLQVFDAVALQKIMPICSTEAEALAAVASAAE
ncbi:MAG: STAS domain-containing protein [Vicinamibacterales bacterium]